MKCRFCGQREQFHLVVPQIIGVRLTSSGEVQHVANYPLKLDRNARLFCGQCHQELQIELGKPWSQVVPLEAVDLTP
ncbi:MAG TPA: hypothetical protein VIN09_01865 [Chloroflexota bacterium]|jgi:hypothetical protein